MNRDKLTFTLAEQMPKERGRGCGADSLYLREGIAEAGLCAMSVLAHHESLALLTLKPDAIVRRRSNRILTYLREEEFDIVAFATARMNRHSMREIWREDWIPFSADRLAMSTLWYSFCEVPVLLLRDRSSDQVMPASARLNECKHARRESYRDRPGLREALEPPNRFMNFVHVADDGVAALHEAAVLLDGPARGRFLQIAAQLPLALEESAGAAELVRLLEAATLAHDLDPFLSLTRLCADGLDGTVASNLERALIEGRRVRWQALVECTELDRFSTRLWDVLAIAAHLIPDFEPG